jgi:hypothetical protein
MTPAPHPLRCETCNKATSEILENGAIRCKGNYLSPDYVRFISEMGCASHSASSDKVLDELERKFIVLNQQGNFRPWNIGHIRDVIAELRHAKNSGEFEQEKAEPSKQTKRQE